MAAESVVSFLIKLLNEETALQGEDLQEVEGNLRRIQTFVHDAQWRQVEEDAVWVWVEKLEDIAYEMEDVVRERRSRSPRTRKWMLWVSCFIPPASSFLNKYVANREISLRIKEIRDKIRSTVNEGEVLGFTSVISDRYKRPKTVPSLECMVFGREPEKSRCLYFLMRNDNEVVSIVGFGGSGKTTLAQFIFNHDTVKAHFDTRIWVHVSNVFDERKVAGEILDSLGVHYSEFEDDKLFQLLETCFSGKRVLLVCDDVWPWEAKNWEPFRNSIRNGAPGSKILVTTRSEYVAYMQVEANWPITLGPLSNYDCWLILKSIALSGRNGEKELIKIGKKIARNCKGSPLVAKIVGGILRSKETVQEWQQVLDSEIWEMEEIGMRLFDELYLTYELLSLEARSCLCYCAVFPKDTAINVDQLIRLWVAQGYFGYPTQADDDNDEESMLDNGMKCFRELEDCSFFQDLAQDSVSIHRNKITSCKIEGLAHDFIKYMGRRDFARLSKRTSSGSTVLSINRKVRSVVIPLDISVDAYLFSQLKRIRALVLSSRELDELPLEVGELSRLQYMDLSDNPIKELPDTICKLYFLEFLDVHFCYLLSSLPQQFGELERMKHLRLNNTTDELQILPQGFEKLRLIQTLDVFHVGGKFEGNIAKLRHLDHIREVCIVVHGGFHFAAARLEEKFEMKNLEFSFAWSGRCEEVAASIQKLQPPPNLETLMLEDYPGYKLPRWILTEPLVSKLKRLSLKSAPEITSLPGLWRLPSLEFLWLYDIPNLCHLGHEFFGFPDPQKQHSEKERRKGYEDDDVDGEIDSDEDGEASDDGLNEVQVYRFHRLKTWRMEHLENFVGWEHVHEFEMELDHKPLVMPSLKLAIINKCPKLKLPPRFQKLAIIDQ